MKSEKIIEALASLGEELASPDQKKVILNAVLEISRLNDENKSVWGLLEEMKDSDIKNYKAQLEAALAEKILLSLPKKKKDYYDKN